MHWKTGKCELQNDGWKVEQNVKNGGSWKKIQIDADQDVDIHYEILSFFFKREMDKGLKSKWLESWKDITLALAWLESPLDQLNEF